MKHFIFASSGSVYGIKEEEKVTEDLPLVPISTYNKTKMVAERVFLSYADRMQVHCIRPATVCGLSPRMRLDVSVNMFTYQALKNQKITITKKAASRLKNIIENEEDGNKGIRVTIDTGGCSGMSYKITFEGEQKEFDKVFDSHGVTIFCDVKSWIYVRGCEIDFSTDLLNGGFKVNNPNATRTCGCGISFSA